MALDSLYNIMVPLVSVLMITYNHDKYVTQAIENVLAQKTYFPIKLFIGEDCSMDRTGDICIEFRDKHPGAIELILNEKNIGMMQNFMRVHKACISSGATYIALCEGDDHWISPYKLQEQVNFLNANKDCAGCFHAVKYIDENRVRSDYIRRPSPIPADYKYSIDYVIRKGGDFFATASAMFRSDAIRELPSWFYEAPVGDSPLMMFAATKGKIGYIDKIMCSYRKNVTNSWSKTIVTDLEELEKYRMRYLEFLSKFGDWTAAHFCGAIAFRVKWVNYSYLSKVILCAPKSKQWMDYFKLLSCLSWWNRLMVLGKLICPTKVYMYLRNIVSQTASSFNKS